MTLLEGLHQVWQGVDHPFLIRGSEELSLTQVAAVTPVDLTAVAPGDVVAVIGDFDASSILSLLHLVELGAVVVPLTVETARDHEYFFDAALVDAVVAEGTLRRRAHGRSHPLLAELRARGHAGLVLFSTGTTGSPKAILHDMTVFLRRFATPRPALRTLSFLLFDHIGGINTLLHTLFNRGVVVAPSERTIGCVLDTCRRHAVEVLPTTPTFLRLMLMGGAIPDSVPPCLKVITYGTERMDQPTLAELCRLLPEVDFRQTYGMSELGIVRVKSEARDSLFMRVGGEGVETRVVNDVLEIRSQSRMLGYLNAPSPFDDDGWFDTKDVVEVKGEYVKVVGRSGDAVNVGGLKFMTSEVERAVLENPVVALVRAYARPNPITGQHVELVVQPAAGAELSRDELMAFLKARLPPHMVPRRIRVEPVEIGHRFKRL